MMVKTDAVIDVDKIPESVAEVLGWRTLEFVQRVLGSEEGRRVIEAGYSNNNAE